MLAGCATADREQPAPQPVPTIERIAERIPDAAPDRILLLADFQRTADAALCRLIRADGAPTSPDPLTVESTTDPAGRPIRALRVMLRPGLDALRFDGGELARPLPMHDWRSYGELVVHLHSEAQTATPLRVELVSGPDARATTALETSLDPGWNHLTIDLSPLVDAADLDRVHGLGFSLPGAAKPTRVALDYLALIDNTNYLLGEDTAAASPFYAYRRGQRLFVGVRGHFGLEFVDGVLVGWRCAGGENIALPTGLGPWLIPLPERWADPRAPAVAYDDPAHFAHWGPAVVARQRVVESTPLRVVVAGVWQFTDRATTPLNAEDPPPEPAPLLNPDAPAITWRYTIYPDGRVYVAVEARSAARAWSQPRLGAALGLAGEHGFRRETLVAGPAVATDGLCWLRAGGACAGNGDRVLHLIWLMRPVTLSERFRMLSTADGRRSAVLAGEIGAAEVIRTTHLLRLAARSADAGDPSELILAYRSAYLDPPLPRVRAGRLARDASGDGDRDGFNEAEGVYEFSPIGGRLVMRWEPGCPPDAVMRVRDTAGREVWIYADGRPLTTYHRDAAGNVVFRCPQPHPATVEVHLSVAADGQRPRTGE